MIAASDRPLCVDLDGTLIRTDLLHEALLQIARQNPLQLPALVVALFAGKAAFKDRVRQLASVDGALLPYREDVVSMVETARSAGRETVLCTASPAEFAGAVASHLGLFSTVLTSSPEVNLAAEEKARALSERYGHGRFDYVGNTDHDLAVFAQCHEGVLVSSSDRLRRQSLAVNPNMTFVDDAEPRLKTWLRAIRVHQWVKNLLIFVPLVAAHAVGDPLQLLAAILAFFACCLCASGTYIVNDLLDLAADRKHHSKKRRPFASGAIPVSSGVLAAVLLFVASGLIATQLPLRFFIVLLAYFAATIAYSFALKRQVIVDVIVLAGLYSLRIIAGAAATSIAPSFWLLGFSMFVFLCLAIVKRVSELQRTIAAGELAGRGYVAEDRYVLISLGTASGLVSVLILALYMQSETATDLYPAKEWLWLVPAAMLYWVARLWLKTTRDQIHDDPIVFATRDWQSLFVLAIVGGLFALATWGAGDMVSVPTVAEATPVVRLRHILLLALILRLGWMLAVPVDPVSDSVIYDLFAQRLAAGQGYTWTDGAPTVYWPVGASALYAAVYAIFGHSFTAVAGLNVVLGTLLVAAIYALARTRFSGQVASLAALGAALWPGWIQLTTILSSELPSTLLLVVGMASILSNRRPHLIYVALGALCLVAASYVRPTILPLIVAVPLLGIWMARGWRPALVSTVLAVVIAAAAIAPWAARNAGHFDKPVLISANFGANLWMGNNPQSTGSYMTLPDGLPANEVVRDDLLARQAVEFIRDNPVRYLQFSLYRVVDSFARETIGTAWNENGLPAVVLTQLKLISSLYWLLAFALSIVGVALFLWERPVRLFDPLVLSPGLFAALAIFVVGGDRYHFGMMPFVAIFAAYALTKGHAAFLAPRKPA